MNVSFRPPICNLPQPIAELTRDFLTPCDMAAYLRSNIIPKKEIPQVSRKTLLKAHKIYVKENEIILKKTKDLRGRIRNYLDKATYFAKFIPVFKVIQKIYPIAIPLLGYSMLSTTPLWLIILSSPLIIIGIIFLIFVIESLNPLFKARDEDMWLQKSLNQLYDILQRTDPYPPMLRDLKLRCNIYSASRKANFNECYTKFKAQFRTSYDVSLFDHFSKPSNDLRNMILTWDKV